MIIELEDGRKVEIQGSPSQDKIDSVLGDIASSSPAPAPVENKQPDSMATQGATGYVGQHPILSLLQGLPQTVTGKTMEQRAIENVNAPDFMQSNTRPFDKLIPRAGQAAENRIEMGQTADQLSAPINYVSGALMSGAAKLTAKAATATGRAFSRIVNRLNPESIPNLNVSPQQRLSDLLKVSTRAAQMDKEGMKSSIRDIRQTQKEEIRTIANQAKDLRSSVGSAINESRVVLKKNLTKLNADLQNAAESGAVDFQEKLPEFFHANSDAYGNRLDMIADSLSASGQGITKQEVSTLVNKTLQDLDEALVPDGPATAAIQALKKKYLPDIEAIPSKFPSAKSGVKPTTNRLTGGDAVDFKELVQDIRNVRSNLSSGAAAGRTGFSQEDLAVQFLNHNLGDYVKVRVPAFADLQQAYSPVIRAMKEAHKIFKPNQGEFNTATATGFLKKAGMGKLEAGQEKLLGALEKGNEFSPGVGELSQPVKTVGSKIKAEVENSPLVKMRENLRGQLDNLEQQRRGLITSSEANVNIKRDLIEKRQAGLLARKVDIENRIKETSRILANKKNARDLRNALLIGGGLIAGTKKAIDFATEHR